MPSLRLNTMEIPNGQTINLPPSLLIDTFQLGSGNRGGRVNFGSFKVSRLSDDETGKFLLASVVGTRIPKITVILLGTSAPSDPFGNSDDGGQIVTRTFGFNDAQVVNFSVTGKNPDGTSVETISFSFRSADPGQVVFG